MIWTSNPRNSLESPQGLRMQVPCARTLKHKALGRRGILQILTLFALLCGIGADAFATPCYKWRFSSNPVRNTVEEVAQEILAWCQTYTPGGYTCAWPYTVYQRNNATFSIQSIGPYDSGYPTHGITIRANWTSDQGAPRTTTNLYTASTVSMGCQVYASVALEDVAAPKSCKANTVGDPINPGTCAMYHKEEDFESQLAGGLKFSRFYASKGMPGTAFGSNWTHSFSQRIQKSYAGVPEKPHVSNASNSSLYSSPYYGCTSGFSQLKSKVSSWSAASASFENGACLVKVSGVVIARLPIYATGAVSGIPTSSIVRGYDLIREDGQAVRFLKSGSTISAPQATQLKLEEISGGFRVTTAQDDVELYDASGKLLSITRRGGIALTAGYDVAGKLQSITNSFGHSIQIGYDVAGKIVSLTRPDGEQITYDYDGSGRLTEVNYPDATSRSYVYENSTFTNALTGIYDESANRFATWGYDSEGRATSSQLAGGAEAVSLVYNSNGTTTVTDALGAVRIFSFHRAGDQNLLNSVSGSRCPDCTEGAATTYDGYGFPNSRTDYLGTVTLYTNNSRGLQVSRTEANGKVIQRTITTAWENAFRLPTLITEPGRTTGFTYDGSGNALTRTITDTATSAARVWTFTYNGSGQVLTENGPRTDVSDITTYTYYSGSATCASTVSGASALGCLGQLSSITNALGHLTTFDEYNAHGQPVKITDPNLVATTLTYDLRHRLTSHSTAGETTSLSYWPTGLVKKVTLPDASFLEYSYDAAHRLTQIEDSDGNHVVYTLDALGNRTAESVYDPSNTLARNRTHVFNSLSRLWKTVGSGATSAVTTEFGYDNNGNQISAEAPEGRDSSSTYDELNRLVQITDPASGLTGFAYDTNDNLLSVTDPRGKITSYTYNGFGDVTQLVSPDTGTTTSTFDGAGNLATQTDARSETASYTYDALNRLTQVDYSDETFAFTYDTGTNNKGRLMVSVWSVHMAIDWVRV